MNDERVSVALRETEHELNINFIGQSDYFSQLCAFFEKKVIGGAINGTLLVTGEPNTFKKAGIKTILISLIEKGLIQNNGVEEIDLMDYGFTLGYNAFLTDLRMKLESSSGTIIFNNVEKASESILTIISEIRPGKLIQLDKSYQLKNGFFMESEEGEDEGISAIQCGDKFYCFICNGCEKEITEDFLINHFQNRDAHLRTQALSSDERFTIKQKVISKVLSEMELDFDIEITVGNESTNGESDLNSIYSYLYQFHEQEDFTMRDYMHYRVSGPLTKILRDYQVKTGTNVLLYIENQEIFCRIDDGIYNLNDYVTPSLNEVKYRLESEIGLKEFKEFIRNIEENDKIQKIRERQGLRNPKLSLNTVFSGDAGVGKSESAKIFFDFLYALGYLGKNSFVEASKSDFLVGTVEDTISATQQIINSALQGVLFIDGIGTLTANMSDRNVKAFWRTLMSAIDKHPEDLIVLLSGKKKEVKVLMEKDGMASKFPNNIYFRDYLPDEMYELGIRWAKEKGYRIDTRLKNDLIEQFSSNQVIEKGGLGNARFVRNVIDNAIADLNKKYLKDPSIGVDLLGRDNFNFNFKANFDLESKLKTIIGLDEVKKLLRAQYQLLLAQEKRRSVGIETQIAQNLNMVFLGNPGTGKTSIARLVAEMLNSMGFLKVGQLIETDRSGFVGENSTETAKKTELKFKEALGGILFIDEAYTLANDSLGRVAIEVLLKLIEDYSSEVIVVLAGYVDEMESFFDVNIGLRSRFPLVTHFEDYSPDELTSMAMSLITSKGFRLSKNAEIELKKSFIDIYENSDTQSGNGRLVRNYIENLIRSQSIRIAQEAVSAYEMNLITYGDFNKMSLADRDDNFDLESKLNEIAGNEQAKEFLQDQYKYFKMVERRKKWGLNADLSKYMNAIFTGEQGTGKHKILNILTEMLFSMGIVKSKIPTEISGQELSVAMSNGSCLEDFLSKSIGKVLVIDKADLFLQEKNFNSVMAEWIKFIDKNKNKMFIVFNGSHEPMKDLMKAYTPLAYRFPIWLHFENYNVDELYHFALQVLEKKGFILDEQAQKELEKTLTEFSENKFIFLKNALMVNQFIDNILREQVSRVYDDKIDRNKINEVQLVDVEKAKKQFIAKNT